MKPITIAVFDAEPINQYLSKKMLGRWKNANISIFNSLEESVSAFKSTNFDFVFIDLNFQHTLMQGIVVLNEIKKISKANFETVAVTPIVLARDLKATMEAGFDYCIEQPITHEDLVAILPPLSLETPIANTHNKEAGEKGISIKKDFSPYFE